MKTKNKEVKLTNIERAVILLAGYMEDPMHSDYRVRDHIIEVLGFEPLSPIIKRKKK